MGKRVSISQPAVIQTELRPLDESFWIDANGQLEQWYYQNTGVFSPDRQITPLKLTPHLSAKDADTDTAYTPTFSIDRWEVKEYVNGAWVTREITSLSPSDAYSIDQDGLTLIVAKNNYDAAHAINITCHAKYNDPRDTGVQCWVSQSTMLLTSIDATQVFPVLNIENPATRMFNPLKDDPIYEFEGSCDWSVIEGQGGTNITEYKADPLGTEEIIQSNDEQMINAAPLLDIKYGDTYIEDAQGNHVPQQFMSRQTSGGIVPTIVDGVAKIENIKGNTVVWNQMINPISYSGTIQSDGWISSRDFNIISGHKYYVYGRRDTAYDYLRIKVYIGTAQVASFRIYSSEGKIIWESNYSGSVVLQIWCGQQYSIIFNAIDLTQMFGAGNEPETVEEFESWLDANVGLKNYYPYCAGKLISYGGYPVKFNQLVQNGNFANGTTGWSGANAYSTVSASQNVLTSIKVGTKSQGIIVGNVLGTISGHQYYVCADLRYDDQLPADTVSIGSGGYNSASFPKNDFSLNVWKHCSGLFTRTTGGDDTMRIYVRTTEDGAKVDVKNVMCIDLTAMFGAGNEQDIEWCNKYLSRDYYDYCPSLDRNIMDIMETKTVVDGVAQYKPLPMGVKTVGFNLWDEEWENGYYDASGNPVPSTSQIRSKNLIKVIPNTEYYAKMSGHRFCYYDANGVFISRSDLIHIKATQLFTTPADCHYIKFHTDYTGTTYNHDVCINISNTSRNGTYEPHWESFSDTSWITKIGIENFNIWDEEYNVNQMINLSTGAEVSNSGTSASKNFIRVLPSTTYYYKNGSWGNRRICFYDSSYNVVGKVEDSSVGEFTTPASCAYLKFFWLGTTYNHDICINKSISHFNGRYYPYGITAPYFPNGLCNVNDVYDEVKIVDGKIKGVVRFAQVDMWDLTWNTQTSSSSQKTRLYSENIRSNIKKPSSNNEVASLVSPIYQSITVNRGYVGDTGISSDKSGSIFVDGTDYTDAATFKAAMSGVMLYYELATPYEFEIDYPTKGQFEWYGIDGNGQEALIDTLPVYSQATQPSGYGQGTSKININALYGEDIAVILRVKRYPWSTNALPPKEYRNVTWRIPPVDVQVVSDKGSAVRAQNQSGDFTFSTIVNQQGDIISDEVKEENMVFDWYYASIPNSGSSSVQSAGSGLTKTISAGTLKNTRPNVGETPSTNVWCEAFVLGAYHLVDGEYVRTKD